MGLWIEDGGLCGSDDRVKSEQRGCCRSVFPVSGSRGMVEWWAAYIVYICRDLFRCELILRVYVYPGKKKLYGTWFWRWDGRGSWWYIGVCIYIYILCVCLYELKLKRILCTFWMKLMVNLDGIASSNMYWVWKMGMRSAILRSMNITWIIGQSKWMQNAIHDECFYVENRFANL